MAEQRLSVRIDGARDDFGYARGAPEFLDENGDIWARAAPAELSRPDDAVLELAVEVAQWGVPRARLEFGFGAD